MGYVWELRFSVSNIGKRGVVPRFWKNEGFREIEARAQILAQEKSQESASHHRSSLLCLAKTQHVTGLRAAHQKKSVISFQLVCRQGHDVLCDVLACREGQNATSCSFRCLQAALCWFSLLGRGGAVFREQA